MGGFYPALSSLCHESLRETAQQVQKKVQIELQAISFHPSSQLRSIRKKLLTLAGREAGAGGEVV